MKKQHLLLAVLLIAAIGAALLFLRRNSPPSSSNYKIGASLALSSPYPLWSKQIQDGITLALEEHNTGNPASSISLIVEDNKGQADMAISAFRKMVETDKVQIVLTAHTQLSLPLQPLALETKTPLVGTVVSALDFGLANEWCFLDWPSHDDLTPPVARYAVETLKLQKGATLCVNDDYGKQGSKLFAETFEKLGGRTVAQEVFTNTDSNLKDQLSRIMAQTPDVIYVVGREQQVIAAVKQGRELGYRGNYVGVNAFDANSVWEALGSAAEGIVFANVETDSTHLPAGAFDSAFFKKFQRKGDWIALYGYTIGHYLAEAISKSEGNRSKLRDELAKLSIITSRGPLRMTDTRSIEMPVSIYQRVNGKNEKIKQPAQK